MPQNIASQDLYKALVNSGVNFFSGVPDSITGEFSKFLQVSHPDEHLAAANEGNAIGVAIGSYLATSKVPTVYMQNSGLGNAVDPLVSLVDPAVFGIPLVLLVGWRGQPNIHDEPQHQKQGEITPDLLSIMGIPHTVLSRNQQEMSQQVELAVHTAIRDQRPYALVIEKGYFTPEDDGMVSGVYALSREAAISVIAKELDQSDAIIAGIGKTSRELFEYREKSGQSHSNDLLVVGGMGHASSIALGVAKQLPDQRVYCIDGDGSVLMHMGALAAIGSQNPTNFCHIVINNGVHDSVGGYPHAGSNANVRKLAEASGYTQTIIATDEAELMSAIAISKKNNGPTLIEVIVNAGARGDLGRPTMSPRENMESFKKFLEN